MKQIVGRVLALIVLAAIVGIGAISISETGTAVETSRITKYESDYDLKADGDLTIVERLTVEFPVSRHGIFRFLDSRFPDHPKRRVFAKDITVTRDGEPEPYSVETASRGHIKSLKIGDANRTLFGSHVYRITYRIEGALLPGENGARTTFYWNLIGTGWTMPIQSSDLTVHLPADAEDVRCAQGAGDAERPCAAEGQGTRTLRVRTGALAPNTPVTIKTGLDIPTPDGGTLPWPSWLDPILGHHVLALVVVLALAGGAAVFGAALSLSTREKKPPFPLMYAPPEGIGPAQAAYLLTERVKNEAFVATMMFAAEQGGVRLDQKDRTWTLIGTDNDAVWTQVDQVTEETARDLGVVGKGHTFTASPSSVSAGQKLKSVLASFQSNTKGWALTSGYMERSGLGGFGIVVLVISLVATVWLGAFNPFHMSILALIPGLFGIMALSVGATGAGTKRTAAGRELWSRIGGFHRVLSTPSAQDRFDFSGRKELYTRYLPWAVAFDCADEWAKKYRIETGEEPPAPDYFPAYAGVHTATYVSNMVDSFDSAMSSAISAYNATQSSSSSGGGGGFSGGGGGGGGGGGSW